MSKIVYISLSLFFGIVGCTNLINFTFASSDISPIEEIKISENITERAKIQGKISRIVPLAGLTVYKLEDETGKIWVVSDRTLGQIDEVVIVEGNLKYKDITIDNDEWGDFYLYHSQESKTIDNDQPMTDNEKNSD